jgi:hypothetical protein
MLTPFSHGYTLPHKRMQSIASSRKLRRKVVVTGVRCYGMAY